MDLGGVRLCGFEALQARGLDVLRICPLREYGHTIFGRIL